VETATSCTRCGGFIVPEVFRDIGQSTIGWHCLLCGEVVDYVILENRARPSETFQADEEMSGWQPVDECEDGSNDDYCLEPVADSTLS
jgi:hypothetical protein